MHPDVRIARIASRQHQIFTFEQALAVGFSPSGIQRRVNRGLWLAMHRGVYALAGVEIGWQQKLKAVELALDGAVSCASAGRVWNIVGLETKPHATVRRLAHPKSSALFVVHRTAELDAVWHAGFRVTNPMRTLLDLSGYLDEEDLEFALDSSLRRRLVAVPSLDAYLKLDRNARRKGAGVLRRLVAIRSSGRPSGSDGETKLFRFLRKYRLPLPVLQHPIDTRRGRRYIDFAYPDVKVAIEFDSWEWHSDRVAFDGERARRNEIEELGWHVLQVTSTQIREEPGILASVVGNTLGLLPSRWRPR